MTIKRVLDPEVDTLPKLVLQNFKHYGAKAVAMRKKDLGIWHRYTWGDYYYNVRYICLGLISLGLRRGDKVNIIGENSPEWFWAQFGVQAAGGVVTGIYTDCVPSEIQYIAGHSEATLIFAEDQEQIDKILHIKDELPNLKRVIYWNQKGVTKYDDPILKYYRDVLELGKQYETEHPESFERSVEQGKADDLALILYTSGTGGLPKGAMITYRTLMKTASLWLQQEPLDEGAQYVSFISPAWSAEEFMMPVLLQAGAVVNFPEAPETVQDNIREIGAVKAGLGPRLWESRVSEIQVKIADASFFNRLMYSLFLPVGYRVADTRAAREKPNLFWRVIHRIAYWLLFRPILDKYGMLKMEHCYTAGGSLSGEAFRFLCALDAPLMQVYSATEASNIAFHHADDVRYDSVGPPFKGVEIRIADSGEILVGGPLIFSGYYKDPEASARVLDKEGWYYTGDAGYIDEDDGHLIFLGRVSDLFEVKGGRIAPEYIEGRLKFSPYIRDAMIVGGPDKPFVTALIQIDFDVIGMWAERNKLPYTTFTDLSQKPEVYDLTQKEVARINKSLPPYARIKRYTHLHKEFDADEAELTRTRKLRRGFMAERYGDVIDVMFAGGESYKLKSEVKYRDGRTATMETALMIRTVE